MLRYDDRDRRIKQDPIAYIKSEPAFHVVTKRNLKGEKRRFDENIGALRQIKELADANGIRLIVLTTPLHHKNMDTHEMGSHLSLLKKISDITNSWDFGG